MKKTFPTCCIPTVALCLAKAQVAKSDFTRNINLLCSYINKGYNDQAADAYSILEKMMSKQIAYLTSIVNGPANKYPAGVSKTTKDDLATDKTLYNKIVTLRTNPTGNGTALLNYLNQFAATLQELK
jgi:hypothetical protein